MPLRQWEEIQEVLPCYGARSVNRPRDRIARNRPDALIGAAEWNGAPWVSGVRVSSGCKRKREQIAEAFGVTLTRHRPKQP